MCKITLQIDFPICASALLDDVIQHISELMSRFCSFWKAYLFEEKKQATPLGEGNRHMAVVLETLNQSISEKKKNTCMYK